MKEEDWMEPNVVVAVVDVVVLGSCQTIIFQRRPFQMMVVIVCLRLVHYFLLCLPSFLKKQGALLEWSLPDWKKKKIEAQSLSTVAVVVKH